MGSTARGAEFMGLFVTISDIVKYILVNFLISENKHIVPLEVPERRRKPPN